MKKLLVFGDSWAEGSGLKNNEKTFGQLIAESLKFDDFENHAVPGTSISYLIEQFNNAMYKSYDGHLTALFFLTSPTRDFVFAPEDDSVNEYHFRIEGGRGFGYHKSFNREWYKYFHSDQLSEFRTNTTLLALQNLCAHFKIDDYYLWGWERTPLWKGVKKTKVYHNTCVEMFGHQFSSLGELASSNNEFIIPNDGHPYQQGHQEIGNYITRWIYKD